MSPCGHLSAIRLPCGGMPKRRLWPEDDDAPTGWLEARWDTWVREQEEWDREHGEGGIEDLEDGPETVESEETVAEEGRSR